MSHPNFPLSFDNTFYSEIPYLSNGRTKEGVDCWGLACLFYQHEFSILLPSYTDEYSSAEERKEVSAAINKHRGSWEEIPCGEESFGDIIILRLMGYPLHIGLVIAPQTMLHTLKGCGTIIERYDSRMWKNRIFGFVRHKERINE